MLKSQLETCRMDYISDIIRKLSTLNGFSKESILDIVSTTEKYIKDSKTFDNKIKSLIFQYKQKKQYGRLYGALIIIIANNKKAIFQDIEATGVFLADYNVDKKLYLMLKRLQTNLKKSDIREHNFYYKRFTTNITFYDFIALTKKNIYNLRQLLMQRNPMIIKSLLVTSELFIIKKHFDIKNIPIPEWLEKLYGDLGNPENFASLISHLIWLANSCKSIKPLELQMPVDNELDSLELKNIISGGRILYYISEISKTISCFGYSLEKIKIKNGFVFKHTAPSNDFEYFYKLGYIREELSREVSKVTAANTAQSTPFSLNVAAKYFAERFLDKIAVWHEEPYPRLRLEMLYHEEKGFIYNEAINSIDYYEDRLFYDSLKNDHLIFKDYDIKDGLFIDSFFKMFKSLLFFFSLNIYTAVFYNEKYSKFSYNSLIRVQTFDDLKKIIALSGFPIEEAVKFIELITWECEDNTYYDLQYNPFISKSNHYIILPAALSCSNILRNTQVSNQIRIKNHGDIFVENCSSLLKKHFQNVVVNKRIKGNNANTEIDIIVLQNNQLYLFECKYSVPPCNMHEMRDIWNDISKGVQQQLLARKILSDPKRARSYIAGWFRGTKLKDLNNFKINCCVITSSRVFGGMCIKDVPIRDFQSFQALLTNHISSFSIVEPNKEARFIRYSLINPNGFTQDDLDDYLSQNSKFFKIFENDISAVSIITDLIPDKVKIARNSFVYERTFKPPYDDYIERMDKIGFYRLPDETKKIKYPMSLKQMKELFKNAVH